ncbi:MAG: RNA polymerase sigma factor [Phycisphaeraceae bacterium]|nr:RNA polymerase sigma factor [Phycisphaeraceae bacterium]
MAAGCRLSAEVLIVRHQSSVRGFLARLSGDASLADDLAQETFVRMLRHAGSFDDRFSMKTWLLTIGRRLLINHHRKQARIKSPAAASDPVTAKEDSPYERTARQDRQSFLERKLAQAMQSLSEAQRDVLVLFYQQQRTIQEIAGMLDLPEGTVKSHLHRARAAVRKNLDLDAEGTERKSTETSRQDQ